MKTAFAPEITKATFYIRNVNGRCDLINVITTFIVIDYFMRLSSVGLTLNTKASQSTG